MPKLEGPPPTKEVFLPAIGGTESYAIGDRRGYRIDADAETANIEFMIPHDFHALVAVEVVWLATASVTDMAFTVDSDYGGHNELYSIHSGTATVTRTTIGNRVYRDDISATLTALSALDNVGIKVSRPAAGNTSAAFLGVRLRYT